MFLTDVRLSLRILVNSCDAIATLWPALLELSSDLSTTRAPAETQALHQLRKMYKAVRPRRFTVASTPMRRRRRIRISAPVVSALPKPGEGAWSIRVQCITLGVGMR